MRRRSDMSKVFRRCGWRCRQSLSRSLFLVYFKSLQSSIFSQIHFAGCIATLLLLSLVDDDVLLRVEIAYGRAGVWWLTVLGSALALLRTIVPGNQCVDMCSFAAHFLP